jgi:CheY-like chemotaxis protein
MALRLEMMTIRSKDGETLLAGRRPTPGAVALKPLVVVVDDDVDVTGAVGGAVAECGYRVSIASNGREALALLAVEIPCLILVDLMMPVMSGSALIQAMRSDPALERIPCVLMTGVNDLMIGVKEDVEVLYKPIALPDLISVLGRYCGR